MADNKVHFGLNNAYYFPMTEVTDPVSGEVTTIYGAPVKWPGAVSIGLSNNASQTDFYADDGVYYVTSSASSYEGDFESASVPRQFKKDIYGWLEDANGALIETKNPVTKYFAFAFETSGDIGGQRTVFYKCSASIPEASSATTEDGTEVQTQTITIKAIGRADTVTLGGEDRQLIQATLNKGDTGYNTFFNAPYVPASAVIKPSVTVKGSTVLSVDETEQLVAVVVPTGSEITWSTSDATKVTVSETGLITGKATGTANITASITVDDATYSDVCAVTVEA